MRVMGGPVGDQRRASEKARGARARDDRGLGEEEGPNRLSSFIFAFDSFIFMIHEFKASSGPLKTSKGWVFQSQSLLEPAA